MNGLVLSIVDGSGIIVDDNGERYKFEKAEIKQGNLKNGSKVNFVNNEGIASDIYLIEQENPISDATETISKGFSKSASFVSNTSTAMNQKINNYTGGSKIRSMSLLAAFGASILILFSGVSDIITLIGFSLEMFALYTLAKIKNNMIFFIYRIKAIISAIIAIFVLQSIVENFLFILSGQNLFFNGLKIVIFIVAIIYSIYSIFKSYTQLGKIFKVRLFVISAWLYILALISPIVFIVMQNLQLILEAPYYLILGHFIVLIFAYLKIRDEKIEVSN